MNAVERIRGAEKLTTVFGYWPSFHDAEVLSLHLDRRPQGEGNRGPTLEVLVHAFEMTSEVDTKGFYVARHNVLVHFRFVEVVELRLDDFNEQNALWGLSLIDLSGRQMERVKWAVAFESSHGLGARFECLSVEIVSVSPYDRSQ